MPHEVHYHPALGPERLFWIDEFLLPAERARILDELPFVFWFPSTVLVNYPDGRLKSVRTHNRVSESTLEEWFTPQLRRTILGVQKRVKRFVPEIDGRRERWQITRYRKGGKFDYHYDCGKWGEDPAGERMHTVLIYLNTPRRGGSTRFPDLDLEIKAKAGRLLVWKNLTSAGERDEDMMHASVPLVEGRKATLVTWVRERNFQREEIQT
jgi:prolyl 4-hydroxylase